MKTLNIVKMIIIFLCVFTNTAQANKKEFYGKKTCHQENYLCLEVKIGESWESLWPDTEMRNMIMKINRRNTKLYPKIVLAVPYSLAMSPQTNTYKTESHLDFSPFNTKNMGGQGNKMVVFDPRLLAWAAYDQNGQQIRWGAASGGADWCNDIQSKCRTPTGTFKIQEKYGPEKRSGKFPLGCRGKNCAPMPYFMKFTWFGVGLHGSTNVPGYNDSHGCVRLFYKDAEWLNKEFTEINTTVIVLPY